MGIGLAELRFLAYARSVSTVHHYKRFKIAKKTGGIRLISAPMPRMKRAQYWILENILTRIKLPEMAHGFVPSRSIVTNAQPHIGASLVINMDLKDFFPTITFPRIKGLFLSLGYSEQVATIIGLLCSEPDTDAVQLDGTAYFVGRGLRFLPQGAPTSPAISNILCCRLDRRLAGMAAKMGFVYTRYADDLTFSCRADGHERLQKLLWRTRQIVTAEGFMLNTAKTRIMHRGRRQEVTGIVVNRKLSIDRKTLKRFRALLFQIDGDGPEGKTWGRGGNIFESIQGYAHFIRMVDPAKGQKYLARVDGIIKKYNYRASRPNTRSLSKNAFRRKAAAGQPPRENWWQAEEKPAPVLVLPKVKTPVPRSDSLPDEQPGPASDTEPVPTPDAPPAPEPRRPAPTWLRYVMALLCLVMGFKISPLLGIFLFILFYALRRR
jgi:retron-type reverse transcriptase